MYSGFALRQVLFKVSKDLGGSAIDNSSAVLAQCRQSSLVKFLVNTLLLSKRRYSSRQESGYDPFRVGYDKKRATRKGQRGSTPFLLTHWPSRAALLHGVNAEQVSSAYDVQLHQVKKRPSRVSICLGM